MFDHAAVVVSVCLVALFLGYRFYSRYLAVSIFETEDDDTPTPATTVNDGVDYVPTNRHVLLGHHFTSVAGAAPIVGPAVACVFGWLPAIAWIVLGVIFMGAVQDFGALVVSVRNGGKSIGEVAASLMGGRARVLFLCLIIVLTWLVLAAFASIIGTLFHKFPASVLPINLEIPIAIAIGWWVHKRSGSILWPSIVAVLVMWGSVWLTVRFPALQVQLPEVAGLSPPRVWVVLLLSYSFITCVLPVWLLLQPRDFINSHQLFLGLGVIYLAIFLANPEISAPAVSDGVPEGMGSVFPVLFITIACGAISGFHSLVSSGTTSKQIATLRHARPIGYGSMLGEGALAIAATMAVAAGLDETQWLHHYHADHASDAAVKGGGLGAFVEGTAHLLQGGFPFVVVELAKAIVAVIVISFAATTLDTACRIQRFCIGELGAAWNLKPLRNLWVGAAIAAFSPLVLVLETSAGAKSLPLWKQIWPVFGAANQMLGALALLVITLWLQRRGKPLWLTGLPAVFLTVVTGTGLIGKIRDELAREEPVLAVLVPSVVLLLLAAAILAEGVLALVRKPRSVT